MSSLEAAIAVTRFGMGAQTGEISGIGGDARDWLTQQLINASSVQVTGVGLQSSAQIGEKYITFQTEQRRIGRSKRRAEEAMENRKKIQREMTQVLVGEISARNAHAIETGASFVERWVRFWSNHFTVGFRKFETLGFVGSFEREAIRANAFGTFEGLLKASTLHAGMLVYLDNHRSFGPSTRVSRFRGMGLNENLAREVLELHTLGVDGGYTQEDVTSFAKALTGWTIGVPAFRRKNIGEVVFEEFLHEPGRQRVLGVSYGDTGRDQALNILRDLAKHPATIRHIAKKLARHFVSDVPPETAVNALELAFKVADGDLTELARAIINLKEAWSPVAQKFKTPEELLISSARALGGYAVFGGVRDLRKIYTSLGQQPFGAPSPEGWSDLAADWAGADAIKKRLEWANLAGQRGQSRIKATGFLENALGGLARSETQLEVSRAESNAQGLTLAIMSPEFQRR